ncbi:MAG: alpha/beta hydrolase [Clostridiales Family XIII bacterium]|jgi:3-oxoadipate enol-lactonase|nr:alpha/beta hydrolase [Clostridiales Family XIII bacterium]
MSERVISGVNLYYEDLGDPDSADVIAFFNGVMASTNSWEGIYPTFIDKGFRVILHDFKGQLKSGKPEGPYTFEEHAREANALLESLGVTKAHLIGTSYGGEVAMKYAVLFPEAVSTISLIDSVSELDEALKSFVLGWKVLCDTNDGTVFFKGMAPSIYGPVFMDKEREFLEERALAFGKVSPDYFTGQKYLYDTFANDVTMTDDLPKISCPALVLCGEDDILKRPKFSRIIAERIPSSEYLLIPDCGHVAILEKPRELTSAILGFILKNS